jgi:hypothetical protein
MLCLAIPLDHIYILSLLLLYNIKCLISRALQLLFYFLLLYIITKLLLEVLFYYSKSLLYLLLNFFSFINFLL